MQTNIEPGQRHLIHQIVRFSRALHNAGVAVNSSNLIDLCRSLWHIDISEKKDFHAAARATLVSSYNDLVRFEQVFGEFWEGRKPISNEEISGDDSSGNEGSNKKQIKKYSFDTIKIDSPKNEPSTEPSYSPDEILMKKDLGTMSDVELEQARRLIAELVSIIANYKSRRRIADNKGTELNFRKMLRRSATRGQDGMELFYRKKRIKKTRLMLLCDVSGSMERYSSFLIQFIYSLRQEITNLEVAVFSTELTVISEYLQTRSVEESLHQVSDVVHDWAGGTNIGQCLREFNDRFAHKMLHSRTIMIILSDGWDRGDAYLMREEMEHLHRRVHKILWLNPLLGGANYQPLCRGIQTALPYIDYFLPAHNLESLSSAVRYLRTAWQ